jgi:hypothetical protein
MESVVAISRRTFVATAATSVLASGFVNLLAPRRAKATAAPAKRLILFFTPNGTVHKFWRPTGTTTNFTFPSGGILEPLARHQSKLIVLDELNYYGAFEHPGGMTAMLTNNGTAAHEGRGMSFDQYIASQIGSATRFPSIEFGVQTSAQLAPQDTRMSYSAPGTFVQPDDNPHNVYSRLFGVIAGGATAADTLRRRRKSVIDAAKLEVSDLRNRLGSEEQAKLDVHLDALRSLERTLAPPAGSCTANDPGTMPSVYLNDDFPLITQQQIDLATQALACGLTNVATIQVGHTLCDRVYSWLGIHDGHHSLSHTDDSRTAPLADFVKTERWGAEQFAYLLDRLEALPDPQGGTLMDGSIVLWVKEMGDSRTHLCQSVPWVIAGRGVFQGGRYLKLSGANHSQVIVSICQQFGLTNQTFGNPATGSGPLAVL